MVCSPADENGIKKPPTPNSFGIRGNGCPKSSGDSEFAICDANAGMNVGLLKVEEDSVWTDDGAKVVGKLEIDLGRRSGVVF